MTITLKTAVIYMASLMAFFIIAYGPLVWIIGNSDPYDEGENEPESFGFSLAVGWAVFCLIALFILAGVK